MGPEDESSRIISGMTAHDPKRTTIDKLPATAGSTGWLRASKAPFPLLLLPSITRMTSLHCDPTAACGALCGCAASGPKVKLPAPAHKLRLSVQSQPVIRRRRRGVLRKRGHNVRSKKKPENVACRYHGPVTSTSSEHILARLFSSKQVAKSGRHRGPESRIRPLPMAECLPCSTRLACTEDRPCHRPGATAVSILLFRPFECVCSGCEETSPASLAAHPQPRPCRVLSPNLAGVGTRVSFRDEARVSDFGVVTFPSDGRWSLPYAVLSTCGLGQHVSSLFPVVLGWQLQGSQSS